MSYLFTPPHSELATSGIAVAQAAPDPAANAVAFQSWVHGVPEFGTVFLPSGDIHLGAPIDFGKRNVQGQGGSTRLVFSGLGSEQDAVSIESDTSDQPRAGKISHLVIEANGGRDGLRFNGGIGCGATDVIVLYAGRDSFHFEQRDNYRYFERSFLADCEGMEPGRYGLCLRLAPFGQDDVQFINKSRFRDVRLTRCGLADIAFLLHDDNGGGTQTKIGGGIRLENFHSQFNAADGGPGREGCSIYVERAATSDAFIDWLTFEDCTFEWNNDQGNAPQFGALKVVDLNNSEPLIGDFNDAMTILTGWGRWWDYNNEPAPVRHAYNVRNPQLGVYTNMPTREMGTPTSKPGTLQIPEQSSVELFDASEEGVMWQVAARTAFNASSHVNGVLMGGASASVESISRSGTLSLYVSGDRVMLANAGSSQVSVHWNVSRMCG